MVVEEMVENTNCFVVKVANRKLVLVEKIESTQAAFVENVERMFVFAVGMIEKNFVALVMAGSMLELVVVMAVRNYLNVFEVKAAKNVEIV